MENIKNDRNEYKRLDFSLIKFEPKLKCDTMEDITPISWSEDVLNGERQVIIIRE